MELPWYLVAGIWVTAAGVAATLVVALLELPSKIRERDAKARLAKAQAKDLDRRLTKPFLLHDLPDEIESESEDEVPWEEPEWTSRDAFERGLSQYHSYYDLFRRRRVIWWGVTVVELCWLAMGTVAAGISGWFPFGGILVGGRRAGTILLVGITTLMLCVWVSARGRFLPFFVERFWVREFAGVVGAMVVIVLLFLFRWPLWLF